MHFFPARLTGQTVLVLALASVDLGVNLELCHSSFLMVKAVGAASGSFSQLDHKTPCSYVTLSLAGHILFTWSHPAAILYSGTSWSHFVNLVTAVQSQQY
jgi:hypothetical protein